MNPNMEIDQTMHHLIGDIAREVVDEAGLLSEHASPFGEFAETGQAYDEYREG